MSDLKQAIQIMAKTELGKELNNEQIEDINAFLISLTGTINEDKLKAPEMF